MIGFEEKYILESCIVCQEHQSLTVQLKPSTAGIRILSIDGGGTRGIVPLETLSILQDLLGANLPIRELFDLAFGTSSGTSSLSIYRDSHLDLGGLIILGLFMRYWDVSKCTKVFRDLTKAFFGLEPGPQSLSFNLQRMIRCWLKDGMYDVKALEKALIEQFGRNTRIFDNYFPRPSGFKAAVTATNIGNASTFLFSNYNGVGVRNEDSGKISDLFLDPIDSQSRLPAYSATVRRA